MIRCHCSDICSHRYRLLSPLPSSLLLVQLISSTVLPALMWPGQLASDTTRVPPSYSDPLPSREGPLLQPIGDCSRRVRTLSSPRPERQVAPGLAREGLVAYRWRTAG